MEVERRVQVLLVQPGEERARVGEQLAVPAVAGPAVRRVPVHVDHEHVERQVVRAELARPSARTSAVAVGPVARPPGAEHPARDERDRAAEARVLADGAGVVVAVAEEVPVLVSGRSGRGSTQPSSGANTTPALSSNSAQPERETRPGLERRAAAHAVDGPPRTAEVVQVDHAGHPAERGRLGPLDAQVARVERPPVRRVPEHERAGVDDGRAVLRADLERRRIGAAVRERVGPAVLEDAVAGPLHPEQPRREHREAGLAGTHLRRLRGDGIARHADALEQRGGRLLSPHATAVWQTWPHGAGRLAIIRAWISRACNAWRRT